MMGSRYEIVEMEGKGKVMIATSDMLPGTEVFHESGPLLFFRGTLSDTSTASYKAFETLSVEQKEKYLDLFGPTSGWDAEVTRMQARFLNNKMARKPTEEEIKTMVKVNSIARLNMFAQDDGHAVYEIASRMSHSCLPNCYEDFTSPAVTCRTILPVKAGEELTIEYNSAHRWKPTHVRRQNYCTKKEFTCHCPRCDAESDDTREFDCFDPQCPGSCFACQPLNQEPIPFNICSYTGVEYVEPHMLPCTVCHRAPPLKYQQDMFALEKSLDRLCDDLQQVHSAAMQSLDVRAIDQALQTIAALNLPRHHSLSIGVLRWRYNFGSVRCITKEGRSAATSSSRCKTPALETYARELVSALEHQCKFPNSQLAEALVDTTFVLKFCPTYSVTFALECCQKALRMFLILHGRNCEGRKKYDDKMVELLPPQPATTTTECMFCGESPLRAAFTLKRCSRCKQVAYCSAGCQKAHWPLHKKCCKLLV